MTDADDIARDVQRVRDEVKTSRYPWWTVLLVLAMSSWAMLLAGRRWFVGGLVVLVIALLCVSVYAVHQ